jgi:tetratricopeptide (TPR) repeat protein
MHELMREALQEHQAPELRKRVHLFLHEYYAKQLEGLDVKSITEKHKAALTEAFYHGRQATSPRELWAWLEPVAEVFDAAGQVRVLLPLYREMTQTLETELGPNHTEVAIALWRLADQLYCLGDYDEAEPFVRRALAIAETGQGPEHPRYWSFMRLLALLLKERGRFDEAETLLRRLVRVRENESRKDAETRVSEPVWSPAPRTGALRRRRIPVAPRAGDRRENMGSETPEDRNSPGKLGGQPEALRSL